MKGLVINRHPTNFSRLPLTLFALILTLCHGSPVQGGEPGSEQLARSFSERKLGPAEILGELGIEAPRSCLDFTDRDVLDARKARWASAIAVLNHTHPDQLVGWIVGSTPPPKAALREAEFQKDCLLAAMIGDVNRSPLRLRVILNYGDVFEGEVANARQLASRFEQTPGWRRRILSHLTQSSYRDAKSQSHIWMRKYLFEGRSFNIVSEQAGERCGLPAGQTWKPESSRHHRCWKEQLSPEEREREILHASSAPGISRHHWGSEFDLFSLNPNSFTDGAPLNHDYQWMTQHALNFGFFQPYRGEKAKGGHAGYMEERWHWSYLPLAQAIHDFIAANETRVERALNHQWDEFEARSNRWRRAKIAYFPFVRSRWRDYVFNIDLPPAPTVVAEAEPEPELEARSDVLSNEP
ncbi:MAG: D-alanyl-D-alanine carboxypeptidase family protein [Bradymonadaceae bacterium]|nr:D-alanyl-D-alanine carboxypeptidase family protein [Lujinxingiaceae bacterium]